MKQIKNKKINRALSVIALSALLISNVGMAPFAFAEVANVTTLAATSVTPTDATLNGQNGPSDAVGHSFWASLAPFSTASPSLPAGVYSTPDLGTLAPNTAFSATLSSVSGLPAVVTDSQYYFAAWSNVGGTWYPGDVMSLTTGLPGTLAAEDFGVVNYNTWNGQIAGYSAGFGLTSATFEGATSVVTQLYSGAVLLQTNTLNGINAGLITGTQISTPFDVSGTFNYVADGYWTNHREAEYGQSIPATRVVATVTLANGKIVTAENNNLVGDATTIYPPVVMGNVTTLSATNISGTNATLRGTNNASNATGHSFWVSLAPFSTASPVVPVDVYTTADLGAISANTSFSASLTSAVGLPAVATSTTYYFVAWSNVDGTWYPGAILNFTTGPMVTPPTDGTIVGEVSDATLHVTSVDVIKGIATANGLFADGWKYLFHITAPTSEQKISMKFSDWSSLVGANTIAAANNMRISSAQADNAGANVLITAANQYFAPVLNMVSDLDSLTAGRQVDVTVDVAVPANTVNGSYTTSYGVKSTI